jgi:MFS family permease
MSWRRRLTALLPDAPAGRLFVALTFVDSLGTGLYLAGAVVFFVRVIGLSDAQVGTALSLAGLTGLATAVPLGAVADRVGARRMLVVVQLWRGACFASMTLVRGPVGFGLVACGLAVAESTTPALSQAVIADVAGDAQRNKTMALVRSVRNIGFAVGAVSASPLIATGSTAATRVIVLGNALSFVVVGVLLSRLRMPKAAAAPAPRKRERGTKRDRGLRNPRYLVLAGLNSVLSLHMTLLPVVIPLWVVRTARAPAWTIPVLMVINTAMAVFLQIPLSRGGEDVPGGARLLRRSGPALAACCLAMIAASALSGAAAVALFAAGMVCMTLAEIWQSAAGWTLSYAFAPAAQRVRYLAAFSLSGLVAQEVVGPGVLGGLMLGAGRIGWLVLAVVFVATVPLVGPVVGGLARAHPGAEADTADATLTPTLEAS